MDIGPVLDLEDVLGGKVCALASRVEPRDYVDVAAALERYTPAQLIGFARRLDLGLTGQDFAEAGLRLDQMDDRVFSQIELSLPDAAGLRERLAAWPRDVRDADWESQPGNPSGQTSSVGRPGREPGLVFAMSARAALVGADPGFDTFAADFLAYLTSRRVVDLRASAIAQARRVGRSLLDEVTLTRRAKQLGAGDAADRLTRFGERLDHVAVRGRDAVAVVGAESARLLAALNVAGADGQQLGRDIIRQLQADCSTGCRRRPARWRGPWSGATRTPRGMRPPCEWPRKSTALRRQKNAVFPNGRRRSATPWPSSMRRPARVHGQRRKRQGSVNGGQMKQSAMTRGDCR